MRFVLLVEGDTEKDSAAQFLKRWLDPQLTQRVGISVVKFNGYTELLQKVVRKAQFYLDNPRNNDIIAVVGLLDLYGPDFYPEHTTSAADRYDWGVAHVEREVNRDRFRMFFAVHEFEAWLLSNPDIFPPSVKRSLPAKTSHPETVNFNEPPAKLLDRVYRQRMSKTYKKTTYGKDLFSKLDPNIAVERCPYLAQMLGTMLALARQAGI